jgi:2-iminoacetate synthase ThiH
MIKTDQDLDEIGEKARSGREIGEDDIVYMYDYADINQLGRIAGSIAREI